MEQSIDVLSTQYEACEMVKYDVSGLSEANLGQTEEKQLLGFLKIVESTFSPINLKIFPNIKHWVPKII